MWLVSDVTIRDIQRAAQKKLENDDQQWLECEVECVNDYHEVQLILVCVQIVVVTQSSQIEKFLLSNGVEETLLSLIEKWKAVVRSINAQWEIFLSFLQYIIYLP